MHHGYEASRNRVDEFTTEFVEASNLNMNVWPLVDASDGAALLVERLPEDAPSGFDLSVTRAYGSYISAPVRAGVAFGMLTINTIDKGGLGEEDKASIQVLARLLGAAEGLTMSTFQSSKVRETSVRMSESRATVRRNRGGSSGKR